MREAGIKLPPELLPGALNNKEVVHSCRWIFPTPLRLISLIKQENEIKISVQKFKSYESYPEITGLHADEDRLN